MHPRHTVVRFSPSTKSATFRSVGCWLWSRVACQMHVWFRYFHWRWPDDAYPSHWDMFEVFCCPSTKVYKTYANLCQTTWCSCAGSSRWCYHIMAKNTTSQLYGLRKSRFTMLLLWQPPAPPFLSCIVKVQKISHYVENIPKNVSIIRCAGQRNRCSDRHLPCLLWCGPCESSEADSNQQVIWAKLMRHATALAVPIRTFVVLIYQLNLEILSW